MKCPKCGYLGFEEVERCRNCGYDFSLAEKIDLPELPIRTEEPRLDLLDDLALIDTTRAPEPKSSFTPDLEKLFGAPVAVPPRARPPRPPLSVRRSTADAPRLRAPVSSAPLLDLGLPEQADDRTDALLAPLFDATLPSTLPDVSREHSNVGAPIVSRAAIANAADLTDAARVADAADADDANAGEPAAAGARIAAAAIDLLILAAVDVVVIYFTMKICGLTVADLDILPKGPLAAFLLLQNGAYLVAFTAGGQTIGKMAAGIRVVATRGGSSLDFGRSLVRTAVWLLLAVPAGLGFLTALYSRDGRGLHDLCAGTRVVRAPTA